MKKTILAVCMLIAASFVLLSPALSAKRAKTKAEPVPTGPITRQFIQNMPLSNGISATITVVGDQSEETRIQSVIGQILSDLSRLDMEINGPPNGEISKINSLSKGERLELSDELFNFISKARALAAMTGGKFDITEGYKRIALDFKKKTFAFKDNDMKIDVATVWPAYLVDMAINKIVLENIANAKVEIGNVNRNVGRDIYTPWNVSVSIPNPNATNAYRAVVYSFSNKAVASQTAETMSAILNGSNEDKSVSNGYKNVTVFGGDSMTVSAFAVALYSMGPKSAPTFVQRHPEVKGVFVDEEGNLSTSRDFQVGRPNYESEPPPIVGLDRGGNDLSQKKREEAKD